ncbi:MAG: SpoIID/LytB domain-containing protein [Bacilli bacterium]|nr:SpoIID/LytB domain-containing protein [Bacilli bacterium]
MKRLFLGLFLILLILTGCKSEVTPRVEQLVIVGDNEIEVGEVIKLSTNISSPVNWFSSDDNIAIVAGGYVTGINVGVVTITAEKVSNILIYDTIEIIVIPKTIESNEENVVYYQTKILSIDKEESKIELLNCPIFQYTPETKFVRMEQEEVQFVTINDFYIGMENIYVACDTVSNTIKTMMMEGSLGFSNIRVGIRNTISDFTNEATLFHSSVTLYFPSEGSLQTYDGTYTVTIESASTLQITINNSHMRITQGGTTLLETTKRVIFSSASEEISITSINRSMGNPKYAGNLEIAMIDQKLVVVNDIDIELYLLKVVPSEMPSSYHVEALKAQAIAARTYAYMDIFNKSKDAFGYTVDDSVASQVYNNANAQTSTTQAVEATKGLIMTHDGDPVQAFFYSTSSGLTASAHDVWISSGETGAYVAYLLGHNLTTDSLGNPIPFDATNEASALTFFKQIQMNTPDTGTSYHRWCVTFTKAQIASMLNANLQKSYLATPALILTKSGDEWVSTPIPTDVGEVFDMTVDKRGDSGVIISLSISTSTGTYKIINQYNIRFTLRPSTAGSNVTVYGATSANTTYSKTWTNPGNLYSAFFAIETDGETFTLYGGGNGHGVGMSQNGANGLAKTGVLFEEILESYYSSIDFTDITYSYQELFDYEDILQFIDSIED